MGGANQSSRGVTAGKRREVQREASAGVPAATGLGKRGPTAKWGKNTGDKGHRGATFKNPRAPGPKEALEQGRLTLGGGSR